MKTKSILALLILLTVAVSVSISTKRVMSMPDPAYEDNPPLFYDLTMDQVITLREEGALVRSRPVGINWPVLKHGHSRTLRINLFEDTEVTVVREDLQGSGDQYVWSGTVQNHPYSDVRLVVKKGTVEGYVTLLDGFYKISFQEGAAHIIAEIDQLASQPELQPISSPVGAFSFQLPDELIPGDPLIDVLVLYTPAARTGAGGDEAIESSINQAIWAANQGYENSLIPQRLRLVHLAETAYIETSDWALDLTRLRVNGDGFMDEIHSLRTAFGADAVALIRSSGGFCGIGYVNRPPIAPYMFSLTAYSCIWPNYTFTHELGHTMGAHHDRDNASGPGAFPYSYGYQDAEPPVEQFRTVMAYDCPNGCTRLNQISNPDVEYYQMGPTGVISTAFNSADNRWTFRNTGPGIANFYPAVFDITIGDIYIAAEFSDWDNDEGNEYCLPDQGGPGDYPGRLDLTGHCVASNQVDMLFFEYSLESISLLNPATMCSLFDTSKPSDANYDYALCFTTDGIVSTAIEDVQLYQCDNWSSSGCGGATLVKSFEPRLFVSGAYYPAGAYWFGNDEDGPFGNPDSMLEVAVPASDLGINIGEMVCEGIFSFKDESSLNTIKDSVFGASGQELNNRIAYDTGTGTGALGGDCALISQTGTLLPIITSESLP